MVPPIIMGRIVDALPKHNFRVLIMLVGFQIFLGILQSLIGYAQGRSSPLACRKASQLT